MQWASIRELKTKVNKRKLSYVLNFLTFSFVNKFLLELLKK